MVTGTKKTKKKATKKIDNGKLISKRDLVSNIKKKLPKLVRDNIPECIVRDNFI